ncbi:MAG: PIN domain-containing protein [Proteobacteria bacterium]|nr:PIN domain-containing protein [Pseudomonadota bacterium]
MLNLDTHILVFALGGELRPDERALLARNRWSVSGIVLWELAKLVELGRIAMDLDDRDVVRALSRLHVWPIDLAVARASTRLDFDSDPADELIAATSVVHGIPLLTRDRTLLGSKIVPLAGAAPIP